MTSNIKLSRRNLFKILSVIVQITFCLLFNELGQAQLMNEHQNIIPLKIVQVGDPVLRQKARPLTKEEILSLKTQQLIKAMKVTMRSAPGVGLAAPQVGLPIQLAVIEDRADYLTGLSSDEIKRRNRQPVPFHVIINPKLTILAIEKSAHFFEGCLSVEGYMASVPRATTVKVDCLNEKAQPITIHATGWYARILQHEIDHLQGTLYLDRMMTTSFSTIDNYKKYRPHP